jgi:hypothetical protein
MWSDDHIMNYLRYREQEDLYMIGVIDRSVQAAMESLGEELEKYLAEAGEPKYKERIDAEQKEAEKKQKEEAGRHGLFTGVAEPFTALGSGFGELFGIGSFGSMFAMGKQKTKKKPSFPLSLGTGGELSKNLGTQLYQCVKNFKKAYGMLSWG